MWQRALLLVILSALLSNCGEPQPTQPPSDLTGIWVGTIDANPMRIEITENAGVFEGALTWEAGNPVHVAQISELNFSNIEYLEIGLARPGTRATVLKLKAKRVGNVLEGTFTKLVGDVALSDSGVWRAEKELHTSTVIGAWRWIKSVGGIAGWELTPPPVVRIEYSSDGVFSYYRNDTLVATTSYTIIPDHMRMSPISADMIHYSDSLQFVPQAFFIVKDTLHLFDQCVDCYNSQFVRIR